MRDSLDTLLERLRGALERAERGDVESGEPLEYVLTEGYAYAMSLESEMQRVERRVAALAGAREVRPRVLKALTQRRREVARRAPTPAGAAPAVHERVGREPRQPERLSARERHRLRRPAQLGHARTPGEAQP